LPAQAVGTRQHMQMIDRQLRGKDHWASVVRRYVAAKAALRRKAWAAGRHAITPEPAMPPIPPEMPPNPTQPVEAPPVVDDPPGVSPPAPVHDPPSMPPRPNASFKQPPRRC